MRLKPEQWTLHHSHRLLHVAVFVTNFAIFALVTGLVFPYVGVNADTITETTDVGVGVRVNAINPGSSESVPTGGGGGAVVAPVLTEGVLHTTVMAAGNGVSYKEVDMSGRKTTVPVFSSQFPSFRGQANMPNTVITLRLSGHVQVSGHTIAGQSGEWIWRSQEPVETGLQQLRVLVTHTQYPDAISEELVFPFLVTLPEWYVPKQPKTSLYVYQPGNSGTLFDVFVSIPSQFQSIRAGDELAANVQFINFGRAGHPVDVEVTYSIKDSKGEMVLESSETVAVATRLSLLKTFYTSESLEPGVYSVTVKVPSKDFIATATDAFTIQAKALTEQKSPAVVQQQPINYSVAFELLLGALFVFCLVAYFEYNKIMLLSRVIRQVDEGDLRLVA